MSSQRETILRKQADDVVICASVRTALTRYKKGGFKDALPEDLLSAVLKATVQRSGIDPKLIEDIAVGNVLAEAGGTNMARMAQLHAGIPHTACIATVHRFCSSGLMAVAQIANQISQGQIDIGIACGVEHMSTGQDNPTLAPKMSEDVLKGEEVKDVLLPMGTTSENVAKVFKVSREEQDAFAANSYQKALKAHKAGLFKGEIIPVEVDYVDPKTGQKSRIVVDSDDGIRENVTAESLSKLKPAFGPQGTTHAGNASQITDGAASVLLVRRSVAERLGLPVLGKFVTIGLAGVKVDVMGIGPAFAIPKALKNAGLTDRDIDFYEINEAFASQAAYSVRELKLDPAKVNPVGGAIAFGHPLGCTGTRQVVTGLAEAKRKGHKVFVTSMCVGTGQGVAGVFVNEQ
ncbi:hypothetical protein NliqN6_1849 [Naganishia liquefaciens]|uniref:Thiolase family protein n=1 Tax=Naganishia liquefaciens TaxID=104408 RepID=A0A8H3TQP6_9TREE|nr:hypothetical protein NliqN6_1849 [Naganishia liquefaciens]